MENVPSSTKIIGTSRWVTLSSLSLTGRTRGSGSKQKKVKDASHVGFQGGQEAGTYLPSSGQGAWSGSVSFKDKLVGEIPGAYA